MCHSHKKFKASIKPWINFKKVHRVIKFHQKVWLKPYIDMNTKPSQKAKYNFEKDFFMLMNKAVSRKFGKSEKIDILSLSQQRRRNYLVLEPNYHTAKCFTENVFAIEMRKTQILMNKPVFLGLSISDLSKTVMYEFWYDYVKPKYVENAKL